MLRRIVWLFAVFTVVGVAFNIKDAYDARRRSELWAAAFGGSELRDGR